MSKNNSFTTGKLLDFDYISNNYRLIAINLSKQIELEKSDLRQQVSFIRGLARNEAATIFFIIEKLQKTILDFLQNLVTIA